MTYTDIIPTSKLIVGVHQIHSIDLCI